MFPANRTVKVQQQGSKTSVLMMEDAGLLWQTAQPLPSRSITLMKMLMSEPARAIVYRCFPCIASHVMKSSYQHVWYSCQWLANIMLEVGHFPTRAAIVVPNGNVQHSACINQHCVKVLQAQCQADKQACACPSAQSQVIAGPTLCCLPLKFICHAESAVRTLMIC